MRQQLELSLNIIHYEQIYQLYEEDLENQIRRNKELSDKFQLLLDKFFIPKKTCLENIQEALFQMDHLFISQLNLETMTLYFQLRDNLQLRSACYQVYTALSDEDVELQSKQELEKFDMHQEYYLNYQYLEQQQPSINSDIKSMDFQQKLQEIKEFLYDQQYVDEINKQMMQKAYHIHQKIKSTIIPQYEQALTQTQGFQYRLEMLKDKEKQLKLQIIYNNESLAQEQQQHTQLRDWADSKIQQMEVYMTTFAQLISRLKTEEERDNMRRLMNATNSDSIKLKEQEEFRVFILCSKYQKTSLKFTVPRKNDQDL
ncbi:hypothetical protein pb186bvf_011353 [Paramecium bursaria]